MKRLLQAVPRENTGDEHSGTDPERDRALFARVGFRIYKLIVSPVLHVVSPSQCIYLPTCSEYAYTAVSRFGVMRGTWLALRRLARCHPMHKGGFDPVPQAMGAAPQSNPDSAKHLS